MDLKEQCVMIQITWLVHRTKSGKSIKSDKTDGYILNDSLILVKKSVISDMADFFDKVKKVLEKMLTYGK